MDQPTILFEDQHLLALNKPSGLPSQPLKQDEEETACHFAFNHCPEISKVGASPLEGGLLHRLDKETSGVLLFAKTQETWLQMRTTWKTHSLKKIYRAIVCLNAAPPRKLPLVLETPIGHSAKSSKRMIVLSHPQFKRQIRGKELPAHTSILKVIRLERNLADFEIEIQTGVMHQIRAHLCSMDWPILGDSIYGSESASRLALHAWKLILPNSQVIEAPLPEAWPPLKGPA